MRVKLSNLHAEKKKCHEASGVSCHTHLLVLAGLSERWTTLETSVSLPPRSVSRNSSPNRLLTVIPRAHAAVSSGAGNQLQAEEECIGIPSGDIPSVPSESDGHHSHSSSSSSECAPPSDSAARPNFDAVMDDRDEVFDNFCFDLTHEQLIEANEAYELL